MLEPVNKRKKEVSGNMPTAFFWFSGHTATLEVDIHAEGWEPGDDASALFRFETDTDIPDHKLDMLRKVAKLAIMEDE